MRGRVIYMEQFFRTHDYLVEHLEASVRRDLMDEIDWSSRMIGIKGTRGVGKTTFLLQYAKEKFGRDRSITLTLVSLQLIYPWPRLKKMPRKR